MVQLKKDECEAAIRSLSHKWADSKGIVPTAELSLSFSEFCVWLESMDYSRYLNFRSEAGALYNAEMWFDKEMKQSWRR